MRKIGEISSKMASGFDLRISTEAMSLRLNVVRQAQANTRIEGLSSEPEAKRIFDEFVQGDIDALEIVPRLKLLYKVP